jgi:hypothetical protein
MKERDQARKRRPTSGKETRLGKETGVKKRDQASKNRPGSGKETRLGK